MKDDELVVLVHGFLRTSRNMCYMKESLKRYGYRVLSPTLPVTTQKVDVCSVRLKKRLHKYSDRKLHFVGHSLGGIVIWHFITHNKVKNLGRVVLIGVPIQGALIARIVSDIFPYVSKLFPSICDIRRPYSLNMRPEVDVGVIAGGRGRRCGFTPFLPGDNDDLIRVKETRFNGMKAFTLKHYIHQCIHKKEDVVEDVVNFLRDGRFKE